MCKAPKPPPAPEPPKPKYLVNPVLDSASNSAISQLRIGRAALRSDLKITPDQAPAAPSLSATSKKLAEREGRIRQEQIAQTLIGRMANIGSVM